MKVTRRQILRMLGGTTLVAAGARRGWTATDKGPIRVGFLVPFTGPFAQSGKDMWDGFRLNFEEVGMRAAGRPIELISEDSWAESAEALTKLRTGRSPSAFSAYTYSAARWMVKGMKAVGGDVENKDRYMAALKQVEISEDPRGPLEVDRWGGPIQNKICSQGGIGRRATPEHRDPHLSQRQSVLDLQAGGVPEEPGVRSRHVPGLPVLRVRSVPMPVVVPVPDGT